MGRKLVDLTGERFGKLTVLQLVPDRKPTSWICKCDCGNVKIVTSGHLKHGTVSCGCHRIEVIAKCAKHIHGNSNPRTRLYRIWACMKQRCNYEKNDNYHNYGGRGIKVCEEWSESFSTFRDWAVTNGYADDLTIDRIDVNGNYEPENCKWVTMKEQAKNKRNNKQKES